MIKIIKILFTKKRLMKSKKSQYLFNEMFKPYSKKELKEMFEEKCDNCKKYFPKNRMHEIKMIDLFNWLEIETKIENINPYYLHDFYLCKKCYKKYFKEVD